MVALVLLAGAAVALLLATTHAPGRKPESSQDVVRGTFSASLTESAALGAPSAYLGTSYVPIRATLSNDQDHDGKPDGMADTLVVLLLCAVVALRTCFVVLVLLLDRLLLRLCEPSILLGSDHYPALERPG